PFDKISSNGHNSDRQQTRGMFGLQSSDSSFVDDDMCGRKMLGIGDPFFPPIDGMRRNKMTVSFGSIEHLADHIRIGAIGNMNRNSEPGSFDGQIHFGFHASATEA